MATITRYPLVRHLRGASTSHVVQMRSGTVTRSGAGLAFWFRPLTTVLSEVPVDDRELPLVAHARSADLQEVTAQVSITYRFADPELAARRIDFGIDPRTGRWTGEPMEQVGHALGELATGHVMEVVAGLTLQEAVTRGPALLRTHLPPALDADPRVRATGLEVVGVRVVSVRTDADLEQALRTPAREAAQAEADRSTFERRALAVERERAIAENELATRIELAARQERLVVQEGANARAKAEEAAAAALVHTRSEAERRRMLAAAEAEATTVQGEAAGAAERARLAAYADVEQGTLLALALQQLAGSLPTIGQVTVTPDLVTGLLAGLGAGGGAGTAGGGR